MTQVIARVEVAGNLPLSGYIQVTASYPFTSTNSLVIDSPTKYELVAGEVTMDLEPSEVSLVTYDFAIYRYDNPEGETLLRSFSAKVPDSPIPIVFSSLFNNTGISRDRVDTSTLSLSRYFYSDLNFWNRLQANLFHAKGEYISTTTYKIGDVVHYDGSGYLCVSFVNFSDIAPPNPQYWQLISSRGATGTGTSGNNTPYGASWDSQLDAPSRNAVYNIIQTLATKSELSGYIINNAANLNNATVATDPSLNNRSSRIPSTNWVMNQLDLVSPATVPIGACMGWFTDSPPSRWLLLDGRTLNRVTYAALFALIGTTYNTGGEAGTVFRLPDLRGRIGVGKDNTTLMGSANRITETWADNLGQSAGNETIVLTQAQLPPHTHTYINAMGNFNGTNQDGTNGTAFSRNNSAVTSSVGSGSPVNIIQPSLCINYIIYAGV